MTSAGELDFWAYGGVGAAIAAVAAAVLSCFLSCSLKPKAAKAAAPADAAVAKKTVDATDDVDDPGRWPGGTLTVYFGSQTGTAEAYAHALVAEGIGHGFKADFVDLEDFCEKDFLKVEKAIFVMASYGRGDPTDNATQFYEWLQNKSGDMSGEHLSSVLFTVFGLGNKQYERYNMMGRTTNELLEKLGARRMFEYGEGDDNEELEEDFESWREAMWEAMVQKYGGVEGSHVLDKAIALPFSVKMLTKEEAADEPTTTEEEATCSTKYLWHAVDAVVSTNYELRALQPGAGSTRHIEIDLEGTGISYQTADNLAILPLNDPAITGRLCVQLGFDPDAIFTLEHDDSHKPVFPTPCTVRDAFLRFMDIMSIPRRSLLEQLVPYLTDEAEREDMLLLSSKDGREMYHRQVEDPGWTLAELILVRFSSLSIKLDHFLHIVPHLHPRNYTISSSSSTSPSRVHITVALLEQEMTQGRVYNGICSSFLSQTVPHRGLASDAAIDEGSKCRVFVRESTFRLPPDPATPILMIGPGTGVAPMRAMLQERAWQKAQGAVVGSNVLYFGCKSRDQDYIYKDDLEAFKADGTLDKLRLAFSREGAAKVYVQHLLHEDAAEVWDLLQRGAYVYVCGGTRMGTDVHNELSRIARDLGLMGGEEAKEFLKVLHTDGRHVQELWS